jgi:type II secretory pathway component GspD/PulD (secretin)
VTPRITPDGIIAMNVFADKSSLAATGVPIFVNPDGSTIESPIIDQSQAQTTVNVPNGQTIVIGGMITRSDASTEAKVPWLGDLPIIGQAFRYDSSASNRTELLIFLTPRIVLSDLDSELIKQVESERMHVIESDAEELHGPLFSVPEPAEASPVEELPQSFIEPMPQGLTPDMANRELLEPDVARAATATRRR